LAVSTFAGEDKTFSCDPLESNVKVLFGWLFAASIGLRLPILFISLFVCLFVLLFVVDFHLHQGLLYTISL